MARDQLLKNPRVVGLAGTLCFALGCGGDGGDAAGSSTSDGAPTSDDTQPTSDDAETSESSGDPDDTTDSGTTGPDPEPFCGDGQIDKDLGEVCDDAGDSVTCTTACTVKAPVSQWTARCVMLEDARIKCWGYNPYIPPHDESGSCGVYPDTMGENCPALDFGDNHVELIRHSSQTLCVVLQDGRVSCLGSWSVGGLESEAELNTFPFELPHGRLPTEASDMTTGLHVLEFPAPVVDVSTFNFNVLDSGATACALTTLGDVYCWGSGHYGQLGGGDEADLYWRADIEASAPLDLPEEMAEVVAGEPCAISVTGKLYCWGPNHNGQLLVGDALARGDDPGEMGNSLLPAALSGKVLSVAGYHVDGADGGLRCALLEDGFIRCWGPVGRLLPELGAEIVGDDPNELWDEVPAFRLDAQVETTKISIGSTVSGCGPGNEDPGASFYLCGLLEDGRVKCVGKAQPFGIGNGLDQCWQTPDQTFAIELGEPAVDVTAGGTGMGGTICALLESRRVKCWGYGPLTGYGAMDGGTVEDFPTAGPELPYLEF